eukprot:m.154611 g.154611  ORF g.154611 m.154611 type:complete len:889 (-) comp14300_c0_seq18:347-3013(-)
MADTATSASPFPDTEGQHTQQLLAAGDCLPVPEVWSMPFTPYDIQVQFMSSLHAALSRGGLGIFESPTGTGKSLSMIVGAMTWLRQEQALEDATQQQLLQGDIEAVSKLVPLDELGDATPAWVLEQTRQRRLDAIQTDAKASQERKLKMKQKLAKLRQEAVFYPKAKKAAHGRRHTVRTATASLSSHGKASKEQVAEEGDEAFLVDEYHSDGEDPAAAAKHSNPTIARFLESSDEENDSAGEEESAPPVKRQIIFCSRTHTQLSQFVSEVKNTVFGEDVKLAALGSRQSLCTHPTVSKLDSLTAINEKCKDLQETRTEVDEQTGKKVKIARCPMLDREKLQDFSDYLLAKPADIEDAASVGHRIKSCSYYAERQALIGAEVIVAPYNMVLHKSTREAVGLNLHNSILLIDEAHNLMDTIGSLHSAKISGIHVLSAKQALAAYKDKYKKRLSSKNLLYVNQLVYILKALESQLQPCAEGEHAKAMLSTVNDFLCQSSLDHLHLFKLLHYLEKSQLPKKLLGFVRKHQHEVTDHRLERHVSPLSVVAAFIQTITNSDKDGRILIEHGPTLASSSVQFMLLNPSVYFEEILQQAHSVIVAGGTMAPIDDFITQLVTPKLSSLEVSLFSCGHVVQGDSILPVCVKAGPSKQPFEFTYGNRNNHAMLRDLGQTLLNVCRIVPGGVVVFFTSYDVQHNVVTFWEKQGTLAMFEKLKAVFREPRGGGNTEACLASYAAAVHDRGGALMFAVVGGRLSEGINFKDELGRCVVMVGLPYPNKHSPALVEKMHYLSTHDGGPKLSLHGATSMLSSGAKDRGQEYYENLCMKAVNQSIGRAIRHRGDYAAILLVDQRYAKPRVVSKLPEWIRKHISTTHESFGPLCRDLARFFKAKKSA